MKHILSAAILVAILVIATPAFAQTQQCAPYPDYARHLFSEYGEVPVSRGMIYNGNLIEVFASSEGSWTLMLILPNGTACLFTSGTGWENLPVPLEPPEETGPSI